MVYSGKPKSIYGRRSSHVASYIAVLSTFRALGRKRSTGPLGTGGSKNVMLDPAYLSPFEHWALGTRPKCPMDKLALVRFYYGSERGEAPIATEALGPVGSCHKTSLQRALSILYTTKMRHRVKATVFKMAFHLAAAKGEGKKKEWKRDRKHGEEMLRLKSAIMANRVTRGTKCPA
ncbi:hypothetical protein TNCV_301991 [Trichonephila clavipes]|nr:hypothetical protein TNCV_301991 [Trichonephila clavipes]